MQKAKRLSKIRKVGGMNAREVVKSLVMIKVTARGITPQYTDKAVSREIEESRGVATGKGTFKVNRFTKKTGNALVNGRVKLSNFVKDQTLPWYDGGWRVCKAEKLQSLLDGVSELKSEYMTFVSYLAEHYDEEKLAAQAEANAECAGGKAGLWREDKFPTVEDIRGKHGVDIFLNTALYSDNRIVGLSDEMSQEIKEKTVAGYTERLESATRDLYGRLSEFVGEYHRKLSGLEKVEGKGKGVKLSHTVKIVSQFCETLRGLNVTGDTNLASLIDDTEKLVLSGNPEALKLVPAEKEKQLTVVGGIMSRLATYGTAPEVENEE